MILNNNIFISSVSIFLVLKLTFVFSSFSKDEEKALNKFRDVIGLKNLPNDYMRKDEYLVRWLRAKKLNVAEAAQMLEKTLKWRNENKIDSILSTAANQAEMARLFPLYTETFDNYGRPIGHLALGNAWNVRRTVLAGKLKDLNIWFGPYYLEKMESKVRTARSSSKNPEKVNGHILIVDLNGYSIREQGCLTCLPFMANFMTVLETHYPQSIAELIMINTPRIYNTLLDFVRPFFSEHTSKTVQVYGYDKEEWKYLKYIEPNQLLSSFGGTINPKLIKYTP